MQTEALVLNVLLFKMVKKPMLNLVVVLMPKWGFFNVITI